MNSTQYYIAFRSRVDDTSSQLQSAIHPQEDKYKYKYQVQIQIQIQSTIHPQEDK